MKQREQALLLLRKAAQDESLLDEVLGSDLLQHPGAKGRSGRRSARSLQGEQAGAAEGEAGEDIFAAHFVLAAVNVGVTRGAVHGPSP